MEEKIIARMKDYPLSEIVDFNYYLVEREKELYFKYTYKDGSVKYKSVRELIEETEIKK